MLTEQILQVAIGVSSFGGVVGLVAYLYFGQDFKRAEESLRGVIEGESLFNAKQVVEILAQFKDDAKRLEALVALTSYSNEKAKDLLQKAKSNVDVSKLSDTWGKHYQQRAKRATIFFSTLAILALVFYGFLSPKEPSKKADATPAAESAASASSQPPSPTSTPPSSQLQTPGGASRSPAGLLLGAIERPTVHLGMNLAAFRAEPWTSELRWQELKKGYIAHEQLPTGTADYKFLNGLLVAVVYSAVGTSDGTADNSPAAVEKRCGIDEWTRVKANLEAFHGPLNMVNQEAIATTVDDESKELRAKLISSYIDKPAIKECSGRSGCRFLGKAGDNYSYYSATYSHPLEDGNRLEVFRSFVSTTIQYTGRSSKTPFIDCLLTVQVLRRSV